MYGMSILFGNIIGNFAIDFATERQDELSNHRLNKDIKLHYKQKSGAIERKIEKRRQLKEEFEARRAKIQEEVEIYLLAKLGFAISWLLAFISMAITLLRLR